MASTPLQGSIALVCYVPDPLCRFVEQMREALPSAYDARPHITLLPPRPLDMPLDQVIRELAQVLTPSAPFSVELSAVCSFSETNLLYLSIDGGSERLNELHSALNTGHLGHQEAFDFKPHLTVAGPFDPISLPTLSRRAEALWAVNRGNCRFRVEEVVLVWLGAGNHQSDWQPLGSFTLKGTDSKERAFFATAANQT